MLGALSHRPLVSRPERERIPVLTYNRDYNAAALYNRGVYGAEFSPLANVKQLVLTLIYTQFPGRALFFR